MDIFTIIGLSGLVLSLGAAVVWVIMYKNGKFRKR